MKSRFGREIAFLCLPVLIIGGVAWWKTRDGAPEDVWSGKARLLTRVRELDVSPIDLYRGYTHRIAIDQWAAGKLPPTPPPRVGAIRSYREIDPRYSPLYVLFRQGKIWKRTLSTSEASGEFTDKSLKTPSVKAEVATLSMETVDSVGIDRSKFTSNYILRLPTSPPIEEAFLCGHTKADLEDRDNRMIGGVNTDDIVNQSELFSQPMKVKLITNIGTAAIQTEGAISTASHQPDWKVETVMILPPVPTGGSPLGIYLSLRPTSQSSTPGRIRMIKPRLLDAKGREVVGKHNGYGNGGPPVPRDNIAVNVNFDVTPKQWKTLLRPLTFQTALSVNDGWPEEVNLELRATNTDLPAKPSKLRFVRQPLPIR